MSQLNLSPEEEKFIAEAARFFERPSLFIKGVDLLSTPLEKVNKHLPLQVQKSLSKVVQASLEKALVQAIKTIPGKGFDLSLTQAKIASKQTGKIHQGMSILSGAIGGAFGLPGALVELPVSTVILLRSIANIAENFGEDLSSGETVLECLSVFSIGGIKPNDDYADSIYYGTRMSLAFAVKEAAAFIAANQAKQILHAVEIGSAPTLVRLLSKIASQFEINVSRKLLLQAAPIFGALGGAAINGAFSHFYNQTAHYHFGLRRLERKYGNDAIQAEYKKKASS